MGRHFCSELDALPESLYAADLGVDEVQFELVDSVLGLHVEVFSREHPPPHFRVRCRREQGTR